MFLSGHWLLALKLEIGIQSFWDLEIFLTKDVDEMLSFALIILKLRSAYGSKNSKKKIEKKSKIFFREYLEHILAFQFNEVNIETDTNSARKKSKFFRTFG